MSTDTFESEDYRLDGDRVVFSCVTCGKELRTHRKRAGQRTTCPQCADPITVPETGYEHDDEFSSDAIAPPNRADADDVPGSRVPCPMCGVEVSRTARVCQACGERLERPTVVADPTGRRFERRVGTVSLSETFTVGWDYMKRHYGLLLGAGVLSLAVSTLVGCLIGMPFGFIGGMATVNFGGPPQRPDAMQSLLQAGINQVGVLIAAAVSALFLAGYVRIRLDLSRRGSAKVESIFKETGVWGSAALSHAVFTALTGVPGALLGALATAGDGGMKMFGVDPARFAGAPGAPGPFFDFDPALAALAFAVGLALSGLSVFVWPYLFLCVDYKLTGFAPLTAAWKVTEGSRLPLLGLMIVQWFMSLGIGLTCFIGALLIGPLIAAQNLAAYEQIAGNYAAGLRDEI